MYYERIHKRDNIFIHPEISIYEAVHNLINLHLFPTCCLHLGQYEENEFVGAKIVWARTGNPFGYGKDAYTYHYRIIEDGFDVQLQAVWADADSATATVNVVAITPDDEDARVALRNWLALAVTGKRPLREAFDYLGLH